MRSPPRSSGAGPIRLHDRRRHYERECASASSNRPLAVGQQSQCSSYVPYADLEGGEPVRLRTSRQERHFRLHRSWATSSLRCRRAVPSPPTTAVVVDDDAVRNALATRASTVWSIFDFLDPWGDCNHGGYEQGYGAGLRETGRLANSCETSSSG